MAYKSTNYKPNEKSREVLERAWQHVKSVPYRVTARWLFYRLLQDGYYKTKDDYNNKFLQLLSRVRHNFYDVWRPDSLADDSRTAIIRGDGPSTPEDWIRAVIRGGVCNLHKWTGQSYYVEVWFEAAAMLSQFSHYTKHITLRPFNGMPSIPYKNEIAKGLERAHKSYGLPLKVLYFGDLDPAGETIPLTTVADIRSWCSVNFDFIRVGLNAGDEVKYDIPENFEHPGIFQWEALGDGDAREMIQGAVAQYVDHERVAKIERTERKTTAAFRDHMRNFPGVFDD